MRIRYVATHKFQDWKEAADDYLMISALSPPGYYVNVVAEGEAWVVTVYAKETKSFMSRLFSLIWGD